MSESIQDELPLFPLHSVMFPGGRLPLQIFEARYLDMISRCLKDDSGFVIVLIRDGDEVVRSRDRSPPRLFDVGTLTRVVNCDAPEDGKLRITVEGQQRVRISATRQGENHQMLGRVESLTDLADPLGDRHPELIELVGTLMLHPMIQHLGIDTDRLNSARLSYLLAQYLPIDARKKHALLCLDDVDQRLDEIARLVNELKD